VNSKSVRKYTQILLGLSILLFSVLRSYLTYLDSDKIHPFTKFGWDTEQYLLSLILGFLGLMLFLAGLKNFSSAFSILVSLMSAMLCWASFMRYFKPVFAIISLTSFSLVHLLHHSTPAPRKIRWWCQSVLVSGASLLALAFFVTSFLSRGN
jgi:hypothetical protein